MEITPEAVTTTLAALAPLAVAVLASAGASALKKALYTLALCLAVGVYVSLNGGAVEGLDAGEIATATLYALGAAQTAWVGLRAAGRLDEKAGALLMPDSAIGAAGRLLG